MTMRNLLPPILLAAILAGCGFKGPLYLPKPKPEAQKPTTPPASDEEDPKGRKPDAS